MCASVRVQDAVVMDRRLVSGTVAGLAAIVLATGGGTLAAFDDDADVPHNLAGAGVLQLDLDRSGGASTALSFTNLQPGTRTTNRLWVAANDAASTVSATLGLAVHNLVDTPAACDVSLGKAEGDIASGISGCAVSDGVISGTPSIGVASRMLEFTATYVAAVDPASCATHAPGTSSLLPTSGPGNLYAAATANAGAGTRIAITGDDGTPVALAPGQGVCIALNAYWPPNVTDAIHASPEHPVDNAAQGDSFSVNVDFDLTQVAP